MVSLLLLESLPSEPLSSSSDAELEEDEELLLSGLLGRELSSVIGLPLIGKWTFVLLQSAAVLEVFFLS